MCETACAFYPLGVFSVGYTTTGRVCALLLTKCGSVRLLVEEIFSFDKLRLLVFESHSRDVSDGRSDLATVPAGRPPNVVLVDPTVPPDSRSCGKVGGRHPVACLPLGRSSRSHTACS